MMPAVAVVPTTQEQIQLVLAKAANLSLVVIPSGGTTHFGAGNVPSRYDVALSLARMDRVVAYEPADLTVTVQAGIRLADLQTLLRAQGQFLPLDPPCHAAATVGGMIATNASGPLRHAHGTVRDWLIGTRVVHAGGASTKSGGRVVKNVAGYDMHKLYVGSLGTLGVVTEATFKLAPLPPVQKTVAVAFDSAGAACFLVQRAHDAGLSIAAAELLAPRTATALLGSGQWHVLARLAGGRAAIERSAALLDRIAADAGATIDSGVAASVWDRWAATFTPARLSMGLSVLPSDVARAIGAAERHTGDAVSHLSATATAGLIRVITDADSPATASAMISGMRAIAGECGGTMIVDAAPADAKQGIDVFGAPRSDIAIMRRLKQEFDPTGVLSPGRFVGGL